MKIEDRYLDGSYMAESPEWHSEDALWKAAHISAILRDNQVFPTSICEVGCGSGDVLVHLASHIPAASMCGYDISPQAATLWEGALKKNEDILFYLGDFHVLNKRKYDLLLMVDVFEHLRDPWTFLEMLRGHASHFIFHIPLDLSASSVVRSKPLIRAREKVGHIHYYTKELALATLHEAGYEICDCVYTGASLSSPNRGLKTRIASLPRRLAYAVNKDLGVRILGGETLLVLAKEKLG